MTIQRVATRSISFAFVGFLFFLKRRTTTTSKRKEKKRVAITQNDMSLWVQQTNGSDFSDRDYQAMIEDYKNNFKDLSFSKALIRLRQ